MFAGVSGSIHSEVGHPADDKDANEKYRSTMQQPRRDDMAEVQSTVQKLAGKNA
jgi:hypothetical protein